jgi:transposase
MRYVASLLFSEKLTLEEGFKNHPKHHVRQRFHAILLSAEGKSVAYISDLYKIRTRTIYEWFNRWEKLGIVGLFILPGRGVKGVFANITEAQVTIITDEILANPQQAKQVADKVGLRLELKVSEKQLKTFLKKS